MIRAGVGARRSNALIAASLAVLLFTAACAKKKRAPAAPAAPRIGWTEDGIASWYGHPYHGRRAANGEVYDMDLLTAAHRTLPFGAIVRVASLDNGKEVTVRITDRGPFVEGRTIDLSRAAARAIRMIGPGTARVRLQLLAYGPPRLTAPAGNGPPSEVPAEFAVQVGAFIDRNRAENLKRSLEQNYQPVTIVPREGERTQWRVLVGSKPSEDEARALAEELRARTGAAFIVRLDR
jgi:rare lipoprotein A